MNKIYKLPNLKKKRKKINVNNRKVECEITGRWFQIEENSAQFHEGEFVTINVMTYSYEHDKEKNFAS